MTKLKILRKINFLIFFANFEAHVQKIKVFINKNFRCRSACRASPSRTERANFAKIRLIKFCRPRGASPSLGLGLGGAPRNENVNQQPPEWFVEQDSISSARRVIRCWECFDPEGWRQIRTFLVQTSIFDSAPSVRFSILFYFRRDLVESFHLSY